MEYKYQPRSCICQYQFEQSFTKQTCLRKVSKVSTSTLAYYSTQVCSSCTKQACKAKFFLSLVRPSGATILLSQTNFPGLCRHLIHLIWIRYISVSVMPSAIQRKSVSHLADEIIVYHVGMPSVKTSTKHSCTTLKGMNLAELLQLCLPGLTGNEGTDGLRLLRTSTFHTLSE